MQLLTPCTACIPLLQGQRAQRIEMLLLHEFYARKFLLPDKLTQRDRDRIAASQPQPPDGAETQPGRSTICLCPGMLAVHCKLQPTAC